jgi:glucosamine kinase
MTLDFLLGVDGGGTGTRAVLAKPGEKIIGRGEAGPSALGQGIAQAWRHVEEAIRAAFDSAGLPTPPWHRIAVAAALSGVSHEAWRRAFVAGDPGLGQLEAETDSLAMLLGAHNARPGAMVAAGTGSVAESLFADGSRRTAGGWGFPIGDEGSGAWLGWNAVRHAQRAIDGRTPVGPLDRHVWLVCGEDRDELEAWCGRAGQFAYAQLAPAVFEYELRDAFAAQLLEQATIHLETLARAVDPQGRLPLAISGSVGTRLAPRLAAALRSRIVPVAREPAEGALLLMRQRVPATIEEAA